MGLRARRASGALARAAAAAGALFAAALPVAGKDPPRRVSPPSFAFYVRRVAPWMDATCAACHRAGAGRLKLEPQPAGKEDLRAREKEFASIARLVDGEAPWRSRLVRKTLSEAEGGLPHAGGALLRTADDAYDDLLDFASGATLDNLPPEPEPGKDRRIRPGEPVTLDGSLSYDRDDDPVSWSWELYARPPGSRAVLTGDREAKASFTPDVGGTYVARLRVHDGKVWSAARPVVLEALDRTGPETPDPVAPSGLLGVDPARLRLVRSVYGDVLGRPPTPPEAIAGAARPAAELAATLLGTLESGRAWLEDASIRLGLVGDAEPVSEGVQALPFRWVAGELTPATAEGLLVLDPAFLRAHPAGPALSAAVAGLLLERPATEAEARAWATPEALPAVLASEAFGAAATRRFVERFLPAGREPSPLATVEPGSTIAWALALVGSPGYVGATEARRRSGDGAFVRAIFADLLGRRPTTGELSALARAAAVLPGSMAGRAAVVDVLLDSGEVLLPLIVDLKDPDAWIADRFLRYLGRAPSPAEARAYRAALMDPDGGPHVAVRALLTTPEYAAR